MLFVDDQQHLTMDLSMINMIKHRHLSLCHTAISLQTWFIKKTTAFIHSAFVYPPIIFCVVVSSTNSSKCSIWPWIYPWSTWWTSAYHYVTMLLIITMQNYNIHLFCSYESATLSHHPSFIVSIFKIMRAVANWWNWDWDSRREAWYGISTKAHTKTSL